MSHRMKGAISVFMVIVYIWVFILMGVLVDGARIRMAEAQAEGIQQIANETMLTYYNRALYEYYDLFGESKISADAMGGMMQNIMQQSMSLELNGDLKEVMDSKWVFSLSGRSYFDPYDLTVDSISVGSNINLLNKEVFKSQVNDSMKYSAPLVLVNNFLNLIDSFGAASDGIKAVTECTEAVSNLSDEIEAYQEAIEELRYKLYNFCEDPYKEISAKKNTSAEAFDPIEYAEEFDGAAESAVHSIKNKIKDSLDQDDNEEDEAGDAEEEKTARKATDAALDKAYETYADKMSKIQEHSQSITQEIEALIEQGKALEVNIAAKQDELNIKGANQASTDVGEIYWDFGTSLNDLQQCVKQYRTTLEKMRNYTHAMQSGSMQSWTTFTRASQSVRDKLKDNYDTEHIKMAEDPTVKSFSENLYRQLDNILSDIDGLDRIEVDDSALKDAEQQVKAQTDADGTPKDSENQIKDTDRLGRVTTIAETTAEDDVNTALNSKYDRKNAQSKSKELGGSLTSLMGTLLGDAGEKLMDNLYSDAYVLTNFRDYVHTYRMLNEDGSNNSEKDGYDTVANIKFLQGERGGLTQEQFQKIETTCAEAEYVLYGIKDTKQCVAAAYASIYAYRLAFNYVSVFLTQDYREAVMNAAKAAGVYAPIVIALLPLASALPQSATDMQLLMEGKCVPLIRTEEGQWWQNSYSSNNQYLAGYSDYLLIMLLMMNGDKKVERMQDIIQMNMRTIDSNFTLENALVDVYAQSTCSVKYLFMTQAFMPAGTRMDGRYSFEIKTSVSY